MERWPTPAEYGRFWFDARKLVTMTEAAFDRRLRAELGISQTLFLVLSVVQVEPGRFNQREVADYLGTTSATVSRQLDIGAQAGYLTVAVSANSRRENTVTLTRAGEEIVAKGDAIVLEESRRLFGGLSPADFAVAARVVSQVLGNASA